MSSMEFVWGQDDVGNDGWIAKGYLHFNPTSPGQFGHDCLEHFPRAMKHGQIADELLALGARLHVRVASGWWWNQKFRISPPESFGGELEYLMRHIHDGIEEPAAITEPELDDDMDAEIEASIRHAVRITNRESSYADNDEREPYTEDSPIMQTMAAWMRRGVRACAARFKDRHPTDVMHLSECLDRDSQQYARGEDGDRLIVRVHEKDMEYQFIHKPLFPEEDR
jgi:hypothetical protein